MGFSPTLSVDPTLLSSGNSFKCHVEALSLQPMEQYVSINLIDDVLHCYCLFLLFVWCPSMTIDVSVQYNGGLLPDIVVLLTQCYYHRETHLNATKRFCLCSL